MIKFRENQQIVEKNKYSVNGMVVIILKGNVNIFMSDDRVKVGESGDIIGIKQLVFNTNWTENVVGLSKEGICIIIDSINLNNIMS